MENGPSKFIQMYVLLVSHFAVMDPDLELRGALVLTGHLTGCGSAIRIIRLLLHPPHPRDIFPHKTIKLLHLNEKETANYPQIRSKNSDEIDHFEEVIHPKQRPKHAFLFVNSFEPPGVPCIFW